MIASRLFPPVSFFDRIFVQMILYCFNTEPSIPNKLIYEPKPTTNSFIINWNVNSIIELTTRIQRD